VVPSWGELDVDVDGAEEVDVLALCRGYSAISARFRRVLRGFRGEGRRSRRPTSAPRNHHGYSRSARPSSVAPRRKAARMPALNRG